MGVKVKVKVKLDFEEIVFKIINWIQQAQIRFRLRN